MKKYLSLITGLVLLLGSVNAQISVIGTQVQHFNITANSLLEVSLMNAGQQQQVIIESKLFNSGNELLMSVRSAPFTLKNGLNTPATVSRQAASLEYGNNNQVNHIKTFHTLPGGLFKLCVNVISSPSMESVDDFCDEIESDLSQFLYLVSPPDKDTLPTAQPLLLWTHSEPFGILGQGEYFRMIVAELNKDQLPEEGILSNSPLLMKNYLTTHEVQYPMDAKTLESGKRYGWQVQKMANDIVLNKTEAWEFTLRVDKPVKDNKYSVLRKTLDAGYYKVENNKIFFRFDEEYATGNISSVIYNSQRQAVKPVVKTDEIKNGAYNIKQNGYNRYEINLDKLNMMSGFYTLEVNNEKGELFLLKFYVE